jgi:trk system potassium uptake protein TrkH
MSKLRPALVVLTPRFFGQRISFFNHLASARSLSLDRPGAFMKILMRGIYIMLIIEAAGALLLYLHWRNSGIVLKSEARFLPYFTPYRPSLLVVSLWALLEASTVSVSY